MLQCEIGGWVRVQMCFPLQQKRVQHVFVAFGNALNWHTIKPLAYGQFYDEFPIA